MKKFKIKSYGIDTENLKYRPEIFEEEFVHISIKSGNSYLLENRISQNNVLSRYIITTKK